MVYTDVFETGVDVKTVASILGHSDVSTTLNLYCHPTDEGKADAIKAGLSSVFKKRKAKKTAGPSDLTEHKI